MPIRAMRQGSETIYEVHVSKMREGQRIQRRCRKSKTLPQARERERTLYIEISEAFKERDMPTLEMWFAEWLKKARLSRKGITVESYKKFLGKNVPHELFRKHLHKITQNDIHQVIFSPSSALKPKSRSNLLQYLRCVFRDALTAGLIAANPCEGIRIRVPESKLEAWTITEVNRFLSEAKRGDHPWYPHWVVTVFTGLRSGELYALKWNDVDLENRRIYITSNWTSIDGYHETKNRRNRVVPISDELFSFLVEYKPKRGDEEFVLPHFNQWTKGEQARVLRQFARSIKLREINFHALRASFITICLLQGVPVVKVQAMVGHQSLDTTMRYVRLVGSDLDGATEKIGIKLPKDSGAQILEFNRSRY